MSSWQNSAKTGIIVTRTHPPSHASKNSKPGLDSLQLKGKYTHFTHFYHHEQVATSFLLKHATLFERIGGVFKTYLVQ